ncbi:hypothetical protein Mp_6g16050 [Marchantia polymorpha subsp. ruderalis]|uniref:Uncharacterized protein n=2 Tax=Marchantia polymorpha TaxID=3197 RepID=A0AAF6BSK4_MARPO|nr:hypothetical protein MARPO_0056s0117 [Marchantia polymorpha]BBN14988.1 hypothetical protein Mp_6g16050 [Marchantia polymorpha subsp. ruderalis]|eukprot:PTQ37672.1 hypothetical protein MARPO_0056s0117 [Marchantia polymorpha]
MEGRFVLDVVVGQRPPILKLLSGKNQPLLIWRDAFLVLNLRFHVVNRVRALHLKSYGLAREGFNEDLHASSQPQDQMQGRFLWM